MDNSVAVHVLECGDNLKHKEPNLFHGEFLPFFDHFAESFVGAELEDDVDIFLVLEDAIELDDVVVMEGFMDFYLG